MGTEARLLLANTQCLSKDETLSPRARSTEGSTAGKNPTNFPARLSIISTSEREENKSVLTLHPHTSYKNRNTSRTPPTITTSTTHFYSFTTCTTCINTSTTNPFTISLYYYYFMSDKVVKANTHGTQKSSLMKPL